MKAIKMDNINLEQEISAMRAEGRTKIDIADSLEISDSKLDFLLDDILKNRARIREKLKDKIFNMSMKDLKKVKLTRLNASLVACRLDVLTRDGLDSLKDKNEVLKKFHERYSPNDTSKLMGISNIEAFNNIPKKKKVMTKHDFWDAQEMLDKGFPKATISKLLGIGPRKIARCIRNGWLDDSEWQKINSRGQRYGYFEDNELLFVGSINEIANMRGLSWQKIKKLLEEPEGSIRVERFN